MLPIVALYNQTVGPKSTGATVELANRATILYPTVVGHEHLCTDQYGNRCNGLPGILTGISTTRSCSPISAGHISSLPLWFPQLAVSPLFSLKMIFSTIPAVPGASWFEFEPRGPSVSTSDR